MKRRLKIGFHPRRFTFALLAQIVFCLVAAPILAAEQWAMPAVEVSRDGEGTPQGSKTPLIRSAFDAADVRPEEVSDAEQSRAKPPAKNGKSRGTGRGVGQTGLAAPFEVIPESSFPGDSGREAPGGPCVNGVRLEIAAWEKPPGRFRIATYSQEIPAPALSKKFDLNYYYTRPSIGSVIIDFSPFLWDEQIVRAFQPLTLDPLAPTPEPLIIGYWVFYWSVQTTGPPAN